MSRTPTTSPLLALLLSLPACYPPATGDVLDGGPDSLAAPDAPAGPDVDEPYPIDHLDLGALTPGTYRGLPLKLTAASAPVVEAVDGVIGVVCIGMSNSQQECNEWISRLAIEPMASQVAPEVRVVNCAVFSNALEQWNDPSKDNLLWDACINTKLAQSGVRLDQVRVLYHKVAHLQGPDSPVTYPDPGSDYFSFYDDLGAFALRVRGHFPAVQAVFSTSRSYGGYNDRFERSEPLSYEQGHSLNSWLRDNPVVEGVWYGWGPYIWAPDCGTGVTNGLGVCYERADYKADGIHPDAGARAKIATMIHERLLEQTWYRAP